jgi:hypothetical protein
MRLVICFLLLLCSSAFAADMTTTAICDGVTNATPQINLDIASVSGSGGGTLSFVPGSICVIKRAIPTLQQGGLTLAHGVSLDFKGATLLLQDNANFIFAQSSVAATAQVSSDVPAGVNVIPVTSSVGFSPGGVVFWRLGQAGDPSESNQFGFATVLATTATSITIDTYTWAPFALASATNPANASIVLLNAPLENFYIKNLKLVTGAQGNPESGISLTFARNFSVENVEAWNPGAGVVAMRFSDNADIRLVNVPVSGAYSQGSKGRIFDLSESTNIRIANVSGRQLDGPAIFSEFSSSVFVDGIEINNKNSTAAYSMFFSTNNSSLSLNNVNITGLGGFILSNNGGSRAALKISNMSINVSGILSSYYPLSFELYGSPYLVQGIQQ